MKIIFVFIGIIVAFFGYLLVDGWLGSEEVVVMESVPVVADSTMTILPPRSHIEIYDGVSYKDNETSITLAGQGYTGSLKAEISKLPALTSIDISNNAFTGLPAEIGQLQSLQILNVANNQLTGLPHELGNLQALQVLDLRGNEISEFDLERITAALPTSTQVLFDGSEEEDGVAAEELEELE